TGKSTMLKQAITLTQTHNSDAQFQGLAPTHAAVNELKDKGVPAQTIQSFLQAMRTQESAPEQYQGTVFLVDESSMLSNRQMDALTDTLSQIGARAVLLGDKAQLQSQEAGKPFELGIRQQALTVTTAKNIVRQNQNSIKTAVEHIIDHETASAVASLERQSEPNLKPEDSQHELTPAVISTYEKTHQDEKVNQEQARQKIYTTAAEEYLSRTEYARENTLMIVYSNQERDQVTELIREGLQKEGSLDTQNVPVSRLKSLGLTREQMTLTHSYKKDDIFTSKNGDYHRITSVDHRHKLVTLANIHTGEVSTLFPAKAHHQYTGLWHESAPPLALNDKIMWRKSEPDRQLMGNEPLTVTGLEGGTLTVKSEHTGKTHQLDMSDMKNSHWDYRYTRTADMAQGVTYLYVISLIR
ncbi:MAG: AAA family ATPase, partial [Pseudomonadales bacterium]|nr:AAA family ATPase [Pseudomonadales bacterium]